MIETVFEIPMIENVFEIPMIANLFEIPKKVLGVRYCSAWRWVDLEAVRPNPKVWRGSAQPADADALQGRHRR
jgi:hypothetical protein